MVSQPTLSSSSATTDTLVKAVKIIPLEVIVRNIAAGSLSCSSRFG
nr:phosphoribosylaminoimidazolesuccinocarboxamide synthase [uncultured Sphaerochaeta sp.]